MEKTLNTFLNYLRFQKNYSEHTLISYANDLNGFGTFLKTQLEVSSWEEVNHHLVRSWVIQMLDDEVARTTIKRKVSALRSFYRFLQRKGAVKLNPAAQVEVPKAPKKVVRAVSAESMARLLNEVEFEDSYWGLTQKLIIKTFYNTGIRLAELINLAIADVNLQNQTITVTGKRNKQRIVPLTDELCKELKAYLTDEERPSNASTEDILFKTSKGKKLYPKLVYNTINFYLRSVSGIDQTSPHVLRHTFATHMLSNGADLNAIKELLGHASLAATQVYTHSSIEQLKQMYNQAHPKSS